MPGGFPIYSLLTTFKVIHPFNSKAQLKLNLIEVNTSIESIMPFL